MSTWARCSGPDLQGLHRLLALGAVAAGAMYLLWFGLRAWHRCRAIEDTPRARIRSAAQGYVELEGEPLVPANGRVRGPLTGIPCAWWDYTIEDRGRGRGRGRDWSTIDRGTSETPFLLDDGTGQCLVDPRGAEVVTRARTVWYGDSEWPEYRLPPGEGILGRMADVLFSGGRYRYTERRLMPQEPLYALGTFRSTGGVSVEAPDSAIATLLRDWKQNQEALLERFDRNHDGRIDAAEWEQARTAARDQVLAQRRARELEPGVNLLGAPDDGRAFLLAAVDEAALARRFRLRAAGGLGGFIGLTALLAWLLQPGR